MDSSMGEEKILAMCILKYIYTNMYYSYYYSLGSEAWYGNTTGIDCTGQSMVLRLDRLKDGPLDEFTILPWKPSW